MSGSGEDQSTKRRTRLIAFSVLAVLSAVGIVLSVVDEEPRRHTLGPTGVLIGAVLFVASVVLLIQTARGRIVQPGQGSRSASELEGRSGFTGRVSSGILAVAIGLALLLKGHLAAYLPWVGVAFVLAGCAVVALAFRYARRP